MKPQTKKIIIIAVAVVSIAAIIYFVFRPTAKNLINRLSASSDIKKQIIGYLDRAKLEQDINANAAANNCTYDQALALTAAYYLVNNGTVDDATWQQWKAEIFAM